MCVVSAVSGHFQKLWPDPLTFPPQEYPNYLELVRKARLYDELMKQPDCPDPDKERWMAELEKRMQEKYGLTPKG